jgi:hypothetical protein
MDIVTIVISGIIGIVAGFGIAKIEKHKSYKEL